MDPQQCSSLKAYLERIADPRQARGQRYSWLSLLAIVCLGLLSGYRHPRAIAQWSRLQRRELIEHLAIERRAVPSEATLRRALQAVSVTQLEQVIARFNQALACQDGASGVVAGPQGEVWQGLALDGKDVRGARAHGATHFLLSLTCHGSGVVLAQAEVEQKTNEIGAAPGVLASCDLRGCVVTNDALLSQRSLALQIRQQGGHYLMGIKDNQPHTLAAITLLFEQPPQPAQADDFRTITTVDRGHGRLEERTLTVSPLLHGLLDWPEACQVLKRTCRRTDLKSGLVEQETHYALTDLTPHQAGPAQLETLWRSHWTIEDRLHYVRDVTFGEDACQVWSGTAPHALAILRNALLALLRHHGWSNIAHALRFYNLSLPKALLLLGFPAT